MKNCGLRIADCGFGKATILLLIFPLLYFTNNLKAQTAYHGGKGDGYAMSATSVHFNENGNPDSVKYADHIYPSPLISGDILSISFQQIPTNQVTVQIIDLIGRICLEEKTSPLANVLTINIPKLAQGMYLVRVINGSSLHIKKVLIVSK